MNYRTLGKTGLQVSTISLGTVSLGIPYGIQASKDFGMPSAEDAVRLLMVAADAGVNLFDTAPAYGRSEDILGKAFSRRPDLYIATKISVPQEKTFEGRRHAFQHSLENSLRRLRRDALDIVQIHNAEAEDISKGEVIEFLLQARQKGLVRFLGASVYGEKAAAKVVENDSLDLLQIAYSILDQRPAKSSLMLAAINHKGVLVRSALLKGVLSKKARALPDELQMLREAAQTVCSRLNCTWLDLPELALRFCLSNQMVSSVLVGPRTLEELEQALMAWHSGPLAERDLEIASVLALNEERWVNPSHWPPP